MHSNRSPMSPRRNRSGARSAWALACGVLGSLLTVYVAFAQSTTMTGGGGTTSGATATPQVATPTTSTAATATPSSTGSSSNSVIVPTVLPTAIPEGSAATSSGGAGTASGASVPLTASIIKSDGPIVAIPRPPLFVLAGNVTLQGLAVDCSTGQPASRVAIYDGVQPSAPYVTDAAIDPAADAASVCANPSGTPVGGFTVIFNSRMLDDGPHTLRLEAQYPGGKFAVTTAEIFLENQVPFDSQDRE